MKNKEKIFKAFLVAYALLLVLHTIGLEWNILTIISLASGLLLAFFAHAKKGYVTILLLAIHMTIEWSHHISHGLTYGVREIALHGIHTIFDFVFLVGEWKRHKKGAIPAIIVGIAIALSVLFFFADNHAHDDIDEDDHARFPFEALVIGGILGCVGSHLFERKSAHNHEHTHTA
jgi:hypothetical protein